MADEAKKEEKKPAAEAAPSKAKGIMSMVLPAVMAGAAAFGGGKLTQVHVAHASEPPKAEAKAPGPTMQLEPFLVSVTDAAKRPHAMKVTLAVEFESATKEEALRTYVPRTRDACLSYLRTQTFEQVSEAETATKVRGELVARLREAGVIGAERILITDFVVQ